MLQTITLEQVKAGARDYYRRKRLIAQLPMTRRHLTYSSGGHRCATSTAFTYETIQVLEAKGVRDGAISDGLIQVEPRSDVGNILAIQSAHDEWAKANTGRLIAKRRFLALIN